MSKQPSSFRRIWTAPIVIALVSLLGLFAALLDDGLNDGLSWVALTTPIAAVIWARLRRRV